MFSPEAPQALAEIFEAIGQTLEGVGHKHPRVSCPECPDRDGDPYPRSGRTQGAQESPCGQRGGSLSGYRWSGLVEPANEALSALLVEERVEDPVTKRASRGLPQSLQVVSREGMTKRGR